MKTNKEFHILYILKINKYIKVGITEITRFEARLKEIEKAFGKIDKVNSFYFGSKSAKTIKNLEKGLHSIFWNYSSQFKKEGSGKTEFFQKKIKDNIKKTILINKSNLDLSGPYYFKENKYLFFKFSSLLFFLLMFFYFKVDIINFSKNIINIITSFIV